MIPPKITAKKTSLLVIDKQKSYLSTSAVYPFSESETEVEAIVAEIDNFIKWCRSKGIEIVWTKMIESKVQSPRNIAEKMKNTETKEISVEGSRNFEFIGIGPEDKEKVIVKKYYDAFAGTGLGSYYKSKGIENVIIVGGYASRCVLASSFGANGRGLNIYITPTLVVNPLHLDREKESMLDIVNIILGYVAPIDVLKSLVS